MIIKDFKIKLVDQNGKLVFSNIDNEYINFFDKNEKSTEIIKTKNKIVRIGQLKSINGSVMGISGSNDDIKSSKIFKSKLALALDSLDYIFIIKREIENKINSDTTRLLHNLTSLNAHNIQEIYSLVPQENLANNIIGHVELVESKIKENTKSCAMMLLRIAKNNAAIKTEFSVFKKLFDASPELQQKNHVVHKVITNILYLFFSDFTDKSVNVKINQSQLKAYFDYESIQVALYYIIENSVKYVLPKSQLSIDINNIEDFISVTFDMTSIQIKQEEKTKIFEEGFSGSISMQTGKAGTGIGLSRAYKIISLNHGKVDVETYPDTIENHMGIPYERNIFIIKLKKEKVR